MTRECTRAQTTTSYDSRYMECTPCFRDDDATSVMTHVDVGIVTIISHWWRRDIVVVVCVIIPTPGVIIHTRVHDHVTSHNS